MTPQADSDTPATKADLQHFLQTIMTVMQDTENRLLAAMDEKIQASENRMLAAMEDLRHDMIGTHKDKISLLDDRVHRLEVHAGFKAA